MRNNYICALDLGSSKIACGLACFSKKGNIRNLFLESIPARGIKKGKISDPIDLSDAIAKLLKIIKGKSGINIKSIYINVYGQDITTKHSHATVALCERGNKIITKRDTERLLEEAKILGSNLGEEVIHQMPLSFKIDEQDNIINPLGLYGHKLEVDLYLICAKSAYIQNISRLINHIGYEIKYMFLSGIAVSRLVFTKELLKKGLNILCDIGSDITQIYLFKDGILQNLKILPLGGNDLTDEFVRVFKIPFELAEDLKISYASIGEYGAFEEKEVMIKKDAYYTPVSRKMICEVITSKAKSLVQSIKNRLGEILPENNKVDSFVVGGRTVLLDGFLEMMETTLGLPVAMIRFSNTEIFDTVKNDIISSTPRFLNYLTTLGLIYEGFELNKRRQIFAPSPYRDPIRKIINRAKEIYQEYF